jgi:hypothetical protein
VAEHESAAWIVPELTEDLLRTLPVPIAAAVHQLKIGRDGQRRRADQAEQRQEELRAGLAAANVRAEKAEALIGKLRTDRDHCFAREVSKGLEARQMRRERDEARARLAEIGKAETQQRIVGVNGTSHPATKFDLENRALWVPSVRLEERQVYAGPWREPADAAQNGRSATETSELQFEASAPATKPEGPQWGAQGLCESERDDETETER